MELTPTSEMSPTIGKLAAALAKAQSAMSPAIKDKDNPYFKSKYADLGSIWESARAHLGSNELSVIQTTSMRPGLVLTTILAHSSGEWVRSDYPIQPIKNDPQGIGSAITYARRYALAAIVGACTEDDDGNAASHSNGQKATPGEPRQAPQAISTPPQNSGGLKPSGPAPTDKVGQVAMEQTPMVMPGVKIETLNKDTGEITFVDPVQWKATPTFLDKYAFRYALPFEADGWNIPETRKKITKEGGYFNRSKSKDRNTGAITVNEHADDLWYSNVWYPDMFKWARDPGTLKAIATASPSISSQPEPPDNLPDDWFGSVVAGASHE